jgi:hypothetical protein
MEHIDTTALTGITGTGKTSMLTDYALNIAELGGKLYTLPGYDVYYDKDHTKKISTQLTMGQLAKMSATEEAAKELYHSVILIDQIESKLNHHRWQGVLPALYENIADQRRKLRAGIVYTMQLWYELLPSIRARTWYLYELRDWHYGNPEYPKGDSVSLTFTDVLGTKTGNIMGVYQYPYVFHPGGVWPFYDTNQWNNPLEQFRKMKIIAEPEVMDLDNLDGATDSGAEINAPSKAELKKIETAKKCIHALYDKNGDKALPSSKVYAAGHLKSNSPNDQRIFNQIADEIGLERKGRNYKREPLLVNK